jgi:hypothetical protein
MAQNIREEKGQGAPTSGHGDSNAAQPFDVRGVSPPAFISRRERKMKKTAVIIAATATFLTSISIAAPASAASFNWGFSTPWFGVQTDRSIGPRHFRARDRAYFGPFSFNTGINLGRGHVARCEARYRSYDRSTDMYITFSGAERRCRL